VLFLCICLWAVVVWSCRVTLFGNPLYLHLRSADEDLIARVEDIIGGKRAATTEPEVRFLQLFSRLTLLELGVFVLEIGLFVYLYVSDILPLLALVALAKGLLLLLVSAFLARTRTREGLFDSLLALPNWLIIVDRFSAFLSGVAALVFFWAVSRM